VLFSINATGSLQWQVNTGSGFVDINMATASSLSLSSVTVGMNGYQYRVKVSGNCSTTYSLAATLTVTPGPSAPTIGTITQPDCTTSTGSIVLNGLPATLWEINPGAIPGNTTSKTITGLTPGVYAYTVTSGGCISGLSLSVQINAAAGAPSAPIVGTITQPNCTTPTGSVY
jgi:hypothetical protein